RTPGHSQISRNHVIGPREFSSRFSRTSVIFLHSLGQAVGRLALVKIFAFVYNATHASILRRWIGYRTCSSGIATFFGHSTTECARRGRKEDRGRQRPRRRKSSER